MFNTKWIIPGIWMIMNITTFIVYAVDKIIAVRNGRTGRNTRRIPERVLLFLSFLLGGLGAILAMELIRHKTSASKWTFTTLVPIAYVLQVVLLIVYACGTNTVFWITLPIYLVASIVFCAFWKSDHARENAAKRYQSY